MNGFHDLNEIYDDSNFGFTLKDRKKKVSSLSCEVCVLVLMTVNSLWVIVIAMALNIYTDTSDDKNGHGSDSGKIAFDSLFKLSIFFAIFTVLLIIRIISKCYLICQWQNHKVDPTIVESRIQFYGFFTVGLAEFILEIVGLILL